jgi:hypothetical protein
MASVLPKPKDPKQTIKEQGGASKKAKPGQQVRVVGGVTGSGLYNPQHSGLNTQTFIPDENGIIRADNGAYKWDERLKRYSAIPGQGRGYLLVDPIPQGEGKKGGGGKGVLAPEKKKVPGTDGVLVSAIRPGGAGSSPGLTTPQITGMSQELIDDPRYGVGDWIHMLNPNNQVPPDLGMYVENGMNPGYTPRYPQGVLV